MNLDQEEVHLIRDSVSASDHDKRIDIKRVVNGCVLDVHFWILNGVINARNAINRDRRRITILEMMIGNVESVTTWTTQDEQSAIDVSLLATDDPWIA